MAKNPKKQHIKEPDDLKIKFYTEDEKFWMEIKEKAEKVLEQLPEEIEIVKKKIRLNKEILKMAERNLLNGA